MSEWIVLGRDGVIHLNGDSSVPTPENVTFIEGSVQAIARLHNAGYKLVVAINQSAIGRGALTDEALGLLHAHINEHVQNAGGQLQGFYYCPHLPEVRCECRKPRTGLFDTIEKTLNTNLSQAYCVGDSLRDLQAAKAKGCQAVLVRTGNGTQTEASILLWPKYGKGTQVFESLADFANHLLSE